MKCSICPHDALLRSIYCPRCRPLVATKAESAKRQVALKQDYDGQIDAFRCRWTTLVLDTNDRCGPLSLCFDHIFPLKSSALATSSMLANSMKSSLGPNEFPIAIKHLALHHEGQPFDKDIIGFIYWAEQPIRLAAPFPGRALHPEEITRAVVSSCDICGQPSFPHSIYCPTCRRFVFWGGHDHRPRVRALKMAWDPVLKGFVCYYTGVLLNLTDPRNPWYMTFDHRIPGNDNTQVMAASWVNAMKTALSEAEFWAVIMEFARFLKEGGEFNRNVVRFRYWNRAMKGRIVA
jgi:hypothetical protein